MSIPPPPSWPHCGQGAAPDTDPHGCPGILVPGHTACLAHLADIDRRAYLAGLSPGADIDHRGTRFTPELLDALLAALKDPATGNPRLGASLFTEAQFSSDASFDGAGFSHDAMFGGAQFSGEAVFGRAQFSGDAWFHRAEFSGTARFDGAQFSRAIRFDAVKFSRGASFAEAQFSSQAWFGEAEFSGDALFEDAKFSGGASFGTAQFLKDACFDRAEFSDEAWFTAARFFGEASFTEAQFSRGAWFVEAQFSGDASFGEVQFSGDSSFAEAQFSRDARFYYAQFEGLRELGPLVCGQQVELMGAVFSLPVTVEIAAREVVCERTRWESTAIVRVRYADVDLSHAVLTAPIAVAFEPVPFAMGDTAMNETLLAGSGLPERARVVSVEGVDAAHLVLTATDLTNCRFAGAFHLDQIRVEGRTTFAHAPAGWHRRGILPVRSTRRRALAEEHHWRALAACQPVPPADAAPELGAWRPGPHHPNPALTPSPEDVAALYRQLRKAFEDGKNEPGAADFYYGECEMRRHDLTGTTRGERRLLWGYWLLSGYGLRASRAFSWLLAAMTLTVLLLMGFGLPSHDPAPATTGTVSGSRISLNTSTSDPGLHGGWAQRMTWARAEKATRVAVNSVVFRSSGQNLTTAGTYIEMTSRLLEPTLLALGVLAIRGRIKR
jgi:hypothetical protein